MILDLVRLSVVDTCFNFDGIFYRQKFGMQMGNCLSPVLSNIYMEFFESRLANAIIPDNVFWVRYVDDIFAVIKQYHDTDAILTNLNNLVPSITFTLEKEENNSIAFLDISVIRHENLFKFKVYRKPTSNNHIINGHSHHPVSVKQSALRSMFLRALNICSPEYLDDEVKSIFNIGYRNDFSSHDIEHCFSMAKKTFYDEKTISERENFIPLPYHPHFDNIVYPLKLLGFKTAFSFPFTIGRSLIQNSPRYEDGVVYRIPCGCNKMYIGQTGKTLEKRISQHKYNIARDDPSSAVNIHTKNCNFPINWKDSCKLFSSSNFTERNIIETACISHTKDTNFNSSFGLYKLDPIVLHIFYHQYRLKQRLGF